MADVFLTLPLCKAPIVFLLVHKVSIRNATTKEIASMFCLLNALRVIFINAMKNISTTPQAHVCDETSAPAATTVTHVRHTTYALMENAWEA